MLHHQHITSHEVWASNAGELIIGEVPGFHAKNYTERTTFHMRFATCGMELDRCEEFFGILGVIGEYA
jgi:hypothetical protein